MEVILLLLLFLKQYLRIPPHTSMIAPYSPFTSQDVNGNLHNFTTIKTRNLCLSGCNSHFSTTVYPTYFALIRFVAENPKKCSVNINRQRTNSDYRSNFMVLKAEAGLPRDRSLDLRGKQKNKFIKQDQPGATTQLCFFSLFFSEKVRFQDYLINCLIEPNQRLDANARCW